MTAESVRVCHIITMLELGGAQQNTLYTFAVKARNVDNVETALGSGASLQTTGSAVTGACCFPDGTCTIETSAGCTGTYQGDGTVCTPNPCPQPCAVLGDFTGDGLVIGDDVQGFVDCYVGFDPLAPGCSCADMNGNGTFEEADINSFVDCLLGISCP